MRLELSRLPVLSLFNEKQGILLRENIIPCHTLEPLPMSRNCHAVIQLNVGQASAHIWYPHVHIYSPFFISVLLSLSVSYMHTLQSKKGIAEDLTMHTRSLNTTKMQTHIHVVETNTTSPYTAFLYLYRLLKSKKINAVK